MVVSVVVVVVVSEVVVVVVTEVVVAEVVVVEPKNISFLHSNYDKGAEFSIILFDQIVKRID